MTILVVDDDDIWVRVVIRYFTQLKYKVLSSYTWAGARALAEQHVPEVILIDGSLPEGTSAGFCAALRADARFDKTALILVSGDDRAADRCKADKFVLKGGYLSEVEAAINEALITRAA